MYIRNLIEFYIMKSWKTNSCLSAGNNLNLIKNEKNRYVSLKGHFSFRSLWFKIPLPYPKPCNQFENLHMRCFAQFQKRKKAHGRVIRSVNLNAEACNFTKSNNPPWVVFMFLILYKWQQIALSITYKFKIYGKN